jgi:hypothetical protein
MSIALRPAWTVLMRKMTTLNKVFPIYRIVNKSILNIYLSSFSGATDFFQNNALGECASMDFPDGLFQFTVYHDSADDWCMHSIKLQLADNPLVGCTPGVRLENGQHFVCDV